MGDFVPVLLVLPQPGVLVPPPKAGPRATPKNRSDLIGSDRGAWAATLALAKFPVRDAAMPAPMAP